MAQALPPGIAGFEAQRAIGRQADATQLQGILQSLQAANTMQTMQEAAQTAPLRRGLLEAQTADALSRPQDRIDARAATREAALARILAQGQQFEQTMRLRERGLTRQEDRDAWDREYQQGRLALETAARQQGAERLFYDTGIRTNVPSAPSPAPAPQGALAGILAGRSPEEAAAITSAAQGVPADVLRPGAGPYNTATQVMQPGGLDTQGALARLQPAPPAPTAPPMDVPSQTPMTPASMSMAQSGGMEGRFPPVGTAAVAPAPAAVAQPVSQPVAAPAAPSAPVMPQFTGSPREVAAARNKWLLDQSKGGTPGSTMGDFTKTGKEFLETIPQTDREFIKKLANYDIDPKTLSTRGGEREKALKQAAQYDPTFDQKNYGATAAAINRFATGPQGNTVRSLNVAIEHMDTARRLGDALKNSDLPLFNTIANEFATQTGKPAPTSFNAVKEIVADEVVKGVIGGAGALADREAAAKKIRDASSPAQMNAVFDSWTELLGGQLKGLERQYQGATRRTDFNERYLTERARAALGGGATGDGLEAQVRGLGVAYEPAKFDYRVVDGKVQRKAK